MDSQLATLDRFAERRPFLGVRRSASGRAWFARAGEREEAIAATIAQRLGVSDILARILASRGVSADLADDFLAPSLKRDLPDPSSFTDMDAAVARLADAVLSGERVAIFGDYDVDGATSAALLHRVLQATGAVGRIYIPHRVAEGYGPNVPAIGRLIEEGASLIVCVDCGSSSFEALAEARRLGADVIVLDHHQMDADRPDAAALVNPNRPDDLSGHGHLAAVGVVFLACVGLVRELRRRNVGDGRLPDLLEHLDLVALGTVCDMVPLVGINRAFVTKGLIGIRHGGNRGLAALLRTARLTGPAGAHHLGFLIGPRINAGGRIGDASLGARLLCGEAPEEDEAIAQRLDELNRERQAMEAEAVAEAMLEAEAEMGRGGAPEIIVCGRPGWHPGLVGLIAARLKERFRRPAFAVSLDDAGAGVGSGRSISGVDLGRAVRRAVAEGVLDKGGGHAMAAGVTVPPDGLGGFRAFLEKHLSAEVRAARSGDAMMIDAAATASRLDTSLVEELERAGPFGSGNPTPVLALPAHRVRHIDITPQGHVRATFGSDAGGSIKAIAFRAADAPLGIMLGRSKGERVHVAGTVSLDHWGGRPTPQLRILDAARPEDTSRS